VIHCYDEVVRATLKRGKWFAEVSHSRTADRLRVEGWTVRSIPDRPDRPRASVSGSCHHGSVTPGDEWRREVHRDWQKALLRSERFKHGALAVDPLRAREHEGATAVVFVATLWRAEVEGVAFERLRSALGPGDRVVLVYNGDGEPADGLPFVRASRSFADACRTGLDAAGEARWALFTQSDVLFGGDDVERAKRLSVANGGALVGPSGGVVLDPRTPRVAEEGRQAHGFGGVRFVDWLAGYWILGPAEAFRWDPDFPLYFEDVDVSISAWAAGHPVVCDPGLGVDHLRSKTISALLSPHEREELRERSRERLSRKWRTARA
jgi:hypothetical protein